VYFHSQALPVNKFQVGCAVDFHRTSPVQLEQS
jgi:hypothetical protein